MNADEIVTLKKGDRVRITPRARWAPYRGQLGTVASAVASEWGTVRVRLDDDPDAVGHADGYWTCAFDPVSVELIGGEGAVG